MPIVTKDPIEKKNYGRKWARWLGDGTIESSTWTVPDGLQKVSESHTDTDAVVVIEGGTIGEDYELLNTITTAAGLIATETITVQVREP